LPVLLSMAAAPTVIALDTATEYCSVAVSHGGSLFHCEVQAGQSHSQRLLPLLQQLLEEHALTLRDVDGIAFGAGPGSFTGLRIACGVAQGLAYGLDVPVVPVGNLEALAAVARARAPRAERIGVAIDARMHEAYWAVYEMSAEPLERPKELSAPALAPLSELGRAMAPFAIDTAAGNAFALIAGPIGVPVLPDARASAEAIARLGAMRLQAGEGVAAHLAAPLYVRDRVAQTVDERRAARSAA
jgi:tRNA threonylcarbamoyladenosine biosynthesis protein TsaB